LTLDRAFAPVARADAEILILGSMPGVASLEATQYYAHPRNAFWRICGELFGFDPTLSYMERLAHLQAKHVALWDVYAACERPGSLDSAIVDSTAEINDFAAFLDAHPAIRTVGCNGAKAHDSFRRFVLPDLGRHADRLTVHGLPSTSPANAGMSHQDKLAAWRKALV
jgi:double-stranded uracil-DNA glycosylase